MGWLDGFLDESMKSDKCRDCGKKIEIPKSRGRGYSRCPECDAIASGLVQPRKRR